MTRRVDAVLVARGLARSRGHARQLIEAGLVRRAGEVVTKPATPVTDADDLSVADPGPNWVGRAALKLVGALEAFGAAGFDVSDKTCVDVGASTGGFTQVLLANGARSVVALDVGHGQLAPILREDPRVTECSGTTVRGLHPAAVGGPFEVLVADLSFISLVLVTGELRSLVTDTGDAMVLIKPQFEVGRERLGKNGIVRTAGDRAFAITEVARSATAAGFGVRALEPSPITGTTGNAEYLCWLTPRPADTLSWDAIVQRADRVTQDDVGYDGVVRRERRQARA